MFSVYVLALSAAIVPATANVVTIHLGLGNETRTGVGQVVGSSGSLTSYAIEEIPGTIVVGPSTYHQTWRYPDGDTLAPSSIDCKVYMSDADSGSTTVSSLPANMMSEGVILVVTITATNTGVRPETTVETVTNPATPASTTAEETKAGSDAKITSTPTGDSSSSLTSGGVVATTSSGAAARLNRSWIGSTFEAVLAVF
ncbi:hypothetical protein N7447_002232 [Penicillium robsamsonii]|uniref:uncharacterized protein n=1 Tax=Penicillium robsamsonii TaxID=1792511 RepID=UPI0025487FC5|nr:uncharacterized protein N7447_002232 [Penicillium robsamsonii]KAJ5836206.1 hypothetical protein N7447_002232 [Penicillium robsamsonii]